MPGDYPVTLSVLALETPDYHIQSSRRLYEIEQECLQKLSNILFLFSA